MQIRLRYENTFTTFEISEEDFTLMIDLDYEQRFSIKDDTSLITRRTPQEIIDEQFNRPEYNCWHKFNRHIDPNPRPRRLDGKRGHLLLEDESGNPMNAEDSLFVDVSDNIERDFNYEYEDISSKIRQALIKKPEWADAFIAVRIYGMSIREYASSIGVDENNITQKLKRATKKLKEFFENHQI